MTGPSGEALRGVEVYVVGVDALLNGDPLRSSAGIVSGPPRCCAISNVGTTDDAGRYQIIGVPAGVWRVYVYDRFGSLDDRSGWWDGKSSYAAADTIDMTNGNKVADFRLAAR